MDCHDKVRTSVGYAPSGTQTVWVSLITCSLFYTVSVQFVDT